MATQAAIIMEYEPHVEPALKVWICQPHSVIPEWLDDRVTSERRPDGTFEIEASDGIVTVERGFSVFEQAGHVFACLPRQMPDKLASIAGDHPAVQELQEKTATMAAQKVAQRHTYKAKAANATAGMLNFKQPIGNPPSPQFAPIDQLQVDDSYQRSIEGGSSQKLITKIAVNWDWRLCLPLLVSRRHGELFVIDGQHRLEAARLRGDIAHLPVVVFDFDDPRAEAELFVAANRSRRTMSGLDDFHAAVVAGDPKAVAVNEIVKNVGLVVGRNSSWQYWKPGEVVFVSSIKRALQTHGAEIVRTALHLVGGAFQGQTLVGGGAIFNGLVALLKDGEKAGEPIDLDLMQIVLAEVGLHGWKEITSGIDSGEERSAAMVKAMREAYAEAVAQ